MLRLFFCFDRDRCGFHLFHSVLIHNDAEVLAWDFTLFLALNLWSRLPIGDCSNGLFGCGLALGAGVTVLINWLI